MPRASRRKSESGIYHIMLRGINRQRIFEDEEDYRRFLGTLERYRTECGYSLLAYCLMPNHVHIVLREGTMPLENVMRRIGASYVYWHNVKYGRTGHLFQDRYRSEPVESDEYLLTVIRYVHWNPVKAGACDVPAAYPYSSCARYFESDGMIDDALVRGIAGREEFERFQAEASEDRCLDVAEGAIQRMTDAKAAELMKRLAGCENASEYQALPVEQRNAGLRAMLAQGVSLRQASRITGISFGIVRKTAATDEHRGPSLCVPVTTS